MEAKRPRLDTMPGGVELGGVSPETLRLLQYVFDQSDSKAAAAAAEIAVQKAFDGMEARVAGWMQDQDKKVDTLRTELMARMGKIEQTAVRFSAMSSKSSLAGSCSCHGLRLRARCVCLASACCATVARILILLCRRQGSDCLVNADAPCLVTLFSTRRCDRGRRS